jgi:hypothetical protein
MRRMCLRDLLPDATNNLRETSKNRGKTGEEIQWLRKHATPGKDILSPKYKWKPIQDFSRPFTTSF